MKEIMTVPEGHPVFGGPKVFDAFQYSPAVAAGGLLFIAGQIGMRADGTIPEDADEQGVLGFERLGALLALRGLGFSSLVDLTTYHVDIDQQIVAFRAIKERYITEAFPAWTILGVAGLARPVLKVEIKAVAVL
jgi:enamine deaminase RidA (YjgF/YER057c/UK114 family)